MALDRLNPNWLRIGCPVFDRHVGIFPIDLGLIYTTRQYAYGDSSLWFRIEYTQPHSQHEVFMVPI